MAESVGKVIRRVSLISLLVFDGAAMGWSFYLGKTLPVEDAGMAWSMFQFLVIVTVAVVISEIVSVIFFKKTVSTKLKHLTTKHPWQGWLLQGLIYAAFISLAVHWVWIW